MSNNSDCQRGRAVRKRGPERLARWPIAAAVAIHAAVVMILNGVPATNPPISAAPLTIALMAQPKTSPAPQRAEAAPINEPVLQTDPPALLPPAAPEPVAEPAVSTGDAVPTVASPSPLGATSPPPPVAATEPTRVVQTRPTPQIRSTQTILKTAKPGHPTPREATPTAPAPAVSASNAPPAAAPTASAEAITAWRGALAAWLRDHRTYPDAARRDGIEGRVVVRFIIERTGEVRDATLERSSGSALLDEATIAMLRGARLPPPPAAADALITVTLPIRYSLTP